MRKFCYIFQILFLVLLWSCVDDVVVDKQKDIRVIADIKGSRILFSEEDSITHVHWEVGDRIGLYSSRQTNLGYRAINKGTTTEFEAIDEKLNAVDGDSIYAYYPWHGFTNNDSIPINSVSQYYKENGSEDFMVYAKSKVEHGGVNLQFEHVFAYLKITIPVDRFPALGDLLYIRSTEQVSCYGSYYPRRKHFEGKTTDEIYYRIPENNLKGKNEIVCYIAILPQTENAILTVYKEYDENSTSRLLFSRKAPDGGFKAGHVYALNKQTQTELEEQNKKEREILTNFFNATNGKQWTNNTNWCSDRPLDEWYGIRVDGVGRVISISLYDNQLTGEIPPEICEMPSLTSLSLSSNQLSGKIPPEIGNMTYLTSLSLEHNQLSGEIPPEIGRLRNLRLLTLYNNQLTGEIPPEIENLTLLTNLDLFNNNLTGNLPKFLVNLPNLKYVSLYNNCLDGIIPDEILLSEQWKNIWNIEQIVNQKSPYKLIYNTYESTDYSRDGEVYLLQKHTKGNGIKVLITGDGYSDRLIEDGTFDKTMREAMEGFFYKEPFTSFREYFDVYAYIAVSKNEVIGEETALKTSVDGDYRTGKFKTNLSVVDQRLNKVLPSLDKNDLTNITTIIVLNTDASFRCGANMWDDGFSICNTTRNKLKSTLIHEACGHGFGYLADEYVEVDGMISLDLINLLKTDHHKDDTFLNVDVTDNPDEVIWSYFLNDTRYTNENLGIYEGAWYYTKGVFRPSQLSIMSFTSEKENFNAPSRWAIYKRIMKLAGESCDFNDFLEYDEINRKMFDEMAKSRSREMYDVENSASRHTSPPTYYDYPSSLIK